MLQRAVLQRAVAGLLLALAYGGVVACSDADEPCGALACAADSLENSDLCRRNGGCPRLEDLTRGCTGSITQQRCALCGIEFTRVVIDDVTDAYFESSGALGAVDVRGQPERFCSWYGADLFGCSPMGEPEQVPCEDAPE